VEERREAKSKGERERYITFKCRVPKKSHMMYFDFKSL